MLIILLLCILGALICGIYPLIQLYNICKQLEDLNDDK